MKNIDRNKYQRIHYWLKSRFGKANKCENKYCLGKSSTYEWALLKGREYEKERSNFIMMCKSCHVYYDLTENSRKKMSEKRKGVKMSDETKSKISISAKKRKNYNIKNLKPQKPINPERINLINKMYNDGYSVKNICSKLNITKPTLYKYLIEKPKRYNNLTK